MPAPETLTLVALVAVAAFAVHAALGFGSGPLVVPVLLLVVEPATAVVAAVLAGMAVNVLQLAGEGRRPRPPVRTLAPLWLAAPPGAAAGALVAVGLDRRTLALIVAGVLVASAAATLAAPRRLPPPVLTAGGALAGAAAAMTGVFGPLLGVLGVGAGCRGDALRDGIAVSFVVVGACAVAASLAATPSTDGLVLAAALLLPAALGHRLGRRGFARLGAGSHRRAVIGAALVGGGLALAQALA